MLDDVSYIVFFTVEFEFEFSFKRTFVMSILTKIWEYVHFIISDIIHKNKLSD